MSHLTSAITAISLAALATACNFGSHYDRSDGYGGSGGGYYGSPSSEGYAGTSGGGPAGAGGGATGEAAAGGGTAGGTASFCENDAACGPGHACSPVDGCVPIVSGCPLTPECIGDPPGYTSEWQPAWQGIDPLFVGSLVGDDVLALVDIDLDFYEDHIYGQGVIVFRSGANEGWLEVIITGTREGDALQGQILERWGARRFDAVFQATLPSASEIVGSVTFASDLGEWNADMHLFRTSPCGCPPDPQACLGNADCPNGGVCLDATCVLLCGSDADCDDPLLRCIDFVCQMPPADPGCDPACPIGTSCVAGACLTDCTHSCDCTSGQICAEGVCTDAPSQTPLPCETDCDCAYADGETCVEGVCTAP